MDKEARRLEELAFSPNLPNHERAEHLLLGKAIAQARFNSCSAQLGNASQQQVAMLELKLRWKAAEHISLRTLEDDETLQESLSALIGDTEILASRACGVPSGDDAILLRLTSPRERTKPLTHTAAEYMEREPPETVASSGVQDTEASLDAIREGRLFLLLSIFIGIISGLLVVAFRMAIEWLSFLLQGSAPAPHQLRLIVAPACAGVIIATILTRYVFPQVRGSGVNQTKAALYINNGYISFRTMIGKFLLSALAIGSGYSLGPEDPSLQIGAGVASLISRRVGLSRDRLRLFAPIGAAAGLARSVQQLQSPQSSSLSKKSLDSGARVYWVRLFSPLYQPWLLPVSSGDRSRCFESPPLIFTILANCSRMRYWGSSEV